MNWFKRNIKSQIFENPIYLSELEKEYNETKGIYSRLSRQYKYTKDSSLFYYLNDLKRKLNQLQLSLTMLNKPTEKQLD